MRKDVRIGAIIGGIIIGVVIVWAIIASTGRGKAKDPIAIDGKGIPPTAPNPVAPNPGAPVGGPPPPAAPATPAPESGNTTATPGRDTSPEVATGTPAPTPPAAPEGTSALPLAPEPGPAVAEPAAGRNSANWAALLGAEHVEGDLQPVRTHTPAPAAAPIDPPPVTPEEPAAEPRPGPTGGRADPPAASPKTAIPPTGGKTHKVAAGETFSSISRVVYGDAKYFKEIVKANPAVDPTHLKPGIVIALPDASEFRKPKTADKAAAPDKAKTPAALAPINPKTEYRVQSTDSLYKISIKLYHNPGKVDAIYELNKEMIGTDPARLKLNMVLKLPEPPAETAAAGRG